MFSKKLVLPVLFGMVVTVGGFMVYRNFRNTPQDTSQSNEVGQQNVTSSSDKQESSVENFHAVSLPSLFKKDLQGSNFTVGQKLSDNAEYTRYYITYKSGELKISGIMNVPKGPYPDGGFPLLILNHGYIDPVVYTNGRGLRREQDYLVKQGFVVIHPDYRNHASSDKDPEADFNFRLGYVEDVINVVEALEKAELGFVNTKRAGMLGHSMGGGVTMNAVVVKPDLIKAAILYAPVSSNYADNFDRWTRPDSNRRVLAEKVIATYGDPVSNPKFWDNISVGNFFSRVNIPIKIFHGTKDESVPLEWSKVTETKLKQAGKSVELVIYENEPHEFGLKWTDFMQQTTKFFKENL